MPEKSTDVAAGAKWLNWLPGIAGALALFLVVSYALTFRELTANANPAAWGAFGDYMGGLLNPLISLFTLIVAMKVWGLQKTELLETRKAVEEQGKTAEQQRREQRFFDLLNLYQEMLKTFSIDGVSGKAALKNWPKLSPDTKNCVAFMHHGGNKFRKNIHQPFVSLDERVREVIDPQMVSLTKEQICDSWFAFSAQFDHYFRTIFSILGELENLLESDHWRYGELFRAQLSGDEITLLAFSLLFDLNGEKMRPLIYKYGLLKYLADSELRLLAIDELDFKAFESDWDKAKSVATPREETHAD